MLQWLVRHQKNSEPDLKTFNNWAAKYRDKPFHRDTLKKAFKKLVNAGVIIIKKFFKWHVSRIELVFLWERKKSRSPDCDRDSTPPYPATSRTDGVQQQPNPPTREQAQIIELLKISGIQFEDYSPLWKFEPDEIEKAVRYYLTYPNIEEIRNPAGWLIQCLRKGWYHSTYLDRSPVKSPQLILLAWNLIKDYVKGCLKEPKLTLYEDNPLIHAVRSISDLKLGEAEIKRDPVYGDYCVKLTTD